MKVQNVIKLIKKSGVKVFAQVSVTNDDMILVELVKQSILAKLEWMMIENYDAEINAMINKNGNVVIN